ncbi:MAG: cell division protein ZapA [Deltaproteobacteria bacterium]|nr:cell division protein ZapA [Deltaproteobacteria bacterium]
MNKIIILEIMGLELRVKSDADDDRNKKIINYLKRKIEESMIDSGSRQNLKAVITAALNIAGDYFELKEAYDRLNKELDNRIDHMLNLIDTHNY